jgi:hypothetical protein
MPKFCEAAVPECKTEASAGLPPETYPQFRAGRHVGIRECGYVAQHCIRHRPCSEIHRRLQYLRGGGIIAVLRGGEKPACTGLELQPLVERAARSRPGLAQRSASCSGKRGEVRSRPLPSPAGVRSRTGAAALDAGFDHHLTKSVYVDALLKLLSERDRVPPIRVGSARITSNAGAAALEQRSGFTTKAQ